MVALPSRFFVFLVGLSLRLSTAVVLLSYDRGMSCYTIFCFPCFIHKKALTTTILLPRVSIYKQAELSIFYLFEMHHSLNPSKCYLMATSLTRKSGDRSGGVSRGGSLSIRAQLYITLFCSTSATTAKPKVTTKGHVCGIAIWPVGYC